MRIHTQSLFLPDFFEGTGVAWAPAGLLIDPRALVFRPHMDFHRAVQAQGKGIPHFGDAECQGGFKVRPHLILNSGFCLFLLHNLRKVTFSGGISVFLSVKIKENAYFIGCCIHILFKKNFLIWTIFKDFVEFVTILLLFYVLIFLALKHVGLSAHCMLACMCVFSCV